MPHAIVLGAQWGDEGKGKVIDALAGAVDLVVRFQGGANAGHTVYVGEEKFVFHLLPSGVITPRVQNVIGNGCVVDVAALAVEIRSLAARGLELPPSRLVVSAGAHLVTPAHRALDALAGKAIGTTGRGIGPTYTDKVARRGVRLVSLTDGTLAAEVERATATIRREVEAMGESFPDLSEAHAELAEAAAFIAPYVGDARSLIHEKDRLGASILYEGGQGALLDIDHGTYPYVTSSNTTIGGAYTGTGVYLEFARRIAVVKAYSTRVGNGPLPTEQEGEVGAFLRERGHEYGATTGRPRRCGWLDLPLLRETFLVNGFTEIALTKMDCLSGLERLLVAVGRDAAGAPVYEERPGWEEPLDGARSFSELPRAAQAYVQFIEEALAVPVRLVSTGPARHQRFERTP
jgi:adenylosuccinate synthase